MIAMAKAQSRLLGAAITAAVIAGLGVVLAPTAMAVPNSAIISSFDNGPVGVSGTVTFTRILHRI